MSKGAKDPAKYFATFPEFTKLSLADREAYYSSLNTYPASYDTSFSGLMTWWNPLDNIAVSELNGNLVIPYWMPGNEEATGLSLIGENKIDESICTLFDHLRSQKKKVELVNVPEFVLSHIRYHEMYTFTEQRDLHEYVMPLDHFYPLKNMTPHWRQKVEKVLDETSGFNIKVRDLDMGVKEERDQLLKAARVWRTRNSINDFGKIEADCMEYSIGQAEKLDVENVCIFVNDELWGFCLYEVAQDGSHAMIKHIKATHELTFGFELLAYFFSKFLIERGIRFGNLGPDYGINELRMFMLTVGTNNFFRKYKIEPRR